MKVYIAGKITGTNKEQTTAKFATAQRMIEAMGFETENPMNFPIHWDTPSHEALQVCLPILRQCNVLFVLNDYRTSEGTFIEINEAMDLSKLIIFEDFNGYNVLNDLSKIAN